MLVVAKRHGNISMPDALALIKQKQIVVASKSKNIIILVKKNSNRKIVTNVKYHWYKFFFWCKNFFFKNKYKNFNNHI